MKTKKEWSQDITNLTTRIYQEFPELSKYITEIPVSSSQEEVTIRSLSDYHHSLEEIINRYAKTHEYIRPGKNIDPPAFPGLPIYPASEDIYQQSIEEMVVDPEDPSKKKVPNERNGFLNEKGFEDDMSGDDLDVPGSELDDQQESVGSEDEENNYYSLGGDNHNDLEEDKG